MALLLFLRYSCCDKTRLLFAYDIKLVSYVVAPISFENVNLVNTFFLSFFLNANFFVALDILKPDIHINKKYL